MRYLCLYKSVETGPPTQAEMETMGALIQEWMARERCWAPRVACRARAACESGCRTARSR